MFICSKHNIGTFAAYILYLFLSLFGAISCRLSHFYFIFNYSFTWLLAPHNWYSLLFKANIHFRSSSWSRSSCMVRSGINAAVFYVYVMYKMWSASHNLPWQTLCFVSFELRLFPFRKLILDHPLCRYCITQFDVI